MTRKWCLRGSFVLTLCIGFFFLGSGTESEAQGTFEPAYVVRTTPGTNLITLSQSVFVPPSTGSELVRLAFGFSTSEVISAGTFYDSLTLTLRDDVGGSTAIYATIDRTGVYWAPTPGGLPIDPANIVRQPIAFPSLTPVYQSQWAYQLVLPVPSSMTGKPLTMYLDLFDNQSGSGSLGWMSQVVPVPEPGAFAFVGLVTLLTLLIRRPQSRA